MDRRTEFLNPNRKLVDAVVDWLCGSAQTPGRVRLVDGARSLAHVLVVVPTAQSGRSLRLALAETAARRGWGGILPPQVVEPIALVKSADVRQRIATSVELRAAFLKFVASTAADGSLANYPHLFPMQRASDASFAFAKDFSAQLAFFDQLLDIWRILAGGGLTMVDVPAHPQAAEKLAAAMGDESVRWAELASFEDAFFAQLHARGLRHQAEDIKLARSNPQPLAVGIEEVALPVLADPVAALYDALAQQRAELQVTVLLHVEPSEADRFDAWGRPLRAAWTDAARCALPGLRDADIVTTATDDDLAQRLAEAFPAPDAEVRRPSLGLCDAALFPELAAAFLNRGYVLTNPERHRLRVSSLGQILANLIDLYAARTDRLPWTPFVALLRTDDVLAALVDGTPDLARADVLAGIDVCQNRFLPTVLPQNLAYDVEQVNRHDRAKFTAFLTAGRALLALLSAAMEAAGPIVFLRRALGAIFARRSLTGTDAEKEFRAATDAVRAVLDSFDNDTVAQMNLSEGATVGLLRKALAEAAYALEPTERNAVSTEGWLELVWSGADHIALAGFTEGAVPDSVVGHPFVPDDLRVALGLTSNAARLARDTMLLTDLVRARAATPGAVRAYLALTNAAGEQRRPSRLLFLVAPCDLAPRVARLFGELPAGGARAARRLEDAWRPRLPMGPVPLPNVSARCPNGRLSASALDTWLRCPFTYLLKYGCGMQRAQEKTELEANDFGQLVHGVLEDYAREQIQRTADGLPQFCDVRDISDALTRLLAVRRAQYGDRLALKIRLQFDAAEGRLLAFAPLQAQWACDGWQIVERPEFSFDNVHPFAGEGDVDLPFRGSIDRIDYKEGVGYRLIDYKTWDKKSDAKKHVLIGGQYQRQHAERLQLPLKVVPTKTTGELKFTRVLSVQLLLYATCLECMDPKFRGHIADCSYVLLGKDRDNVAVFGSGFEQGTYDVYKRACDRVNLLEWRNMALDTARTAIRRIRGNFFWPPGPTEDWKFDFKELFLFTPEKDFPIGTPWRDAQEAKLNELEVGE